MTIPTLPQGKWVTKTQCTAMQCHNLKMTCEFCMSCRTLQMECKELGVCIMFNHDDTYTVLRTTTSTHETFDDAVHHINNIIQI